MNNMSILVRTEIKYSGIIIDKILNWGTFKRKKKNSKQQTSSLLLISEISLYIYIYIHIIEQTAHV